MVEMVGRLGDEHSRFLPPSDAQRQDVLTSGREEQVGIGVIVLPLSDALLIQHVFPDSPAEQAGLQPRDRIVAIDGASYSQGDIQGPEGSQVRLTVVRPGEASLDLVITRRRSKDGSVQPRCTFLATLAIWGSQPCGSTTWTSRSVRRWPVFRDRPRCAG